MTRLTLPEWPSRTFYRDYRDVDLYDTIGTQTKRLLRRPQIFDAIAFDRVTESVQQLLTPDPARALLSFCADETLTARIEELAAKK